MPSVTVDSSNIQEGLGLLKEIGVVKIEVDPRHPYVNWLFCSVRSFDHSTSYH